MPIAKPLDYSFFQTSVKSHAPDVTCESNFLHPAHFGGWVRGAALESPDIRFPILRLGNLNCRVVSNDIDTLELNGYSQQHKRNLVW